MIIASSAPVVITGVVIVPPAAVLTVTGAVARAVITRSIHSVLVRNPTRLFVPLLVPHYQARGPPVLRGPVAGEFSACVVTMPRGFCFAV